LRHHDALGGLVVLQNAANRALGGAQRGVQHVHERTVLVLSALINNIFVNETLEHRDKASQKHTLAKPRRVSMARD
jgi:hypothetical protein